MYYNQPNQTVYRSSAPAVMNNFPVNGQPPNMTQTGIPFDQIRQDITNILAAKANDDAAAYSLWQQASAHNQWNSGAYYTAVTDQLVQLVSMMVDSDYFSQIQAYPNQQPNIQAIYNNAIEEAWWSTWAKHLSDNQALAQDPSIAQNQFKLTQWNNYIQLLNQRMDIFARLGLLQNYAPQNVSVFNTASFQNMQRPQQPVMYSSRGNNIGQFTNRPMFPTNNANGNYSNTPWLGINQLQQHQQTPQNNPYNQQGLSSADIAKCKQRDAEEAFKAEVLAERQRQNQVGLPPQPTPPAPRPAQPQSFGESLNQGSVLGSKQPVLYSSSQGNTGNGNSFMPKQPHEVKPLVNSATIDRDLRPQEQFEYTKTNYSTTGNGFNSQTTPVKVTDDQGNLSKEGLTKMFGEMLREEANDQRQGLQQDEERYLTREELHLAYRKGFKFEGKYKTPLTANPWHYRIHAVLTKNNTVRQYIHLMEKEGETMELSTHADILNPLRHSRIVQKDENSRKILSSTFAETTLGGVVFDRFKEAKEVLQEALTKVYTDTEEGSEDRTQGIDEAFKAFELQMQKDIENDYNGVSKYKHLNPQPKYINDEEYQEQIDEDLPTHTRQRLLDKENVMVKAEKAKVVMPADDVNGILAGKLLHDLADNFAVSQDRIVEGNFEGVKLLHVFNTPSEKTETLALLKPFTIQAEKVKSDKEADKPRSSEELAQDLTDLFDKIPLNVWTYLDNRYTKRVNDGLAHIVGVKEITIDSFAEDMSDLYDYLREHCQDHPDLQQAVILLEGYILAGIPCLVPQEMEFKNLRSGYLASDDDGLDHIPLRALMVAEYRAAEVFPITAEAAGFTEKLETVTYDSQPGLYNLLTNLLQATYESLQGLNGYDYPINEGNYMVFSDNTVYQVYPSTQVENRDTSTMCDAFTLVKVN